MSANREESRHDAHGGWTVVEQQRLDERFRNQIGRCEPVVHCPRDSAPLAVWFRRHPLGEHPEFPDSREFLEFLCEACGRRFSTPW